MMSITDKCYIDKIYPLIKKIILIRNIFFNLKVVKISLTKTIRT